MMPGMNVTSTTNVKLPLAFILYGLFAFGLSQILLLFHIDSLVDHIFRIPPIWMAAHFLLLGFVIMVIMGAMYQLVPVAFLTPIWNQTFAYIQYVITVIGITLFALLLGFYPTLSIYGAAIVLIGIFMFIIQMILTISKQKDKNMITTFVLGALTCLIIAIMVGFLLAWNLSFGEVLNQLFLLKTHILFGVAGWFTLLIFGFSYKLIPMFSLSHGFTMRWAKPAFIVYSCGLLSIIISIWTTTSILGVLGFILLFLGFNFFALDVKDILKNRMRRKLDRPLSFAILAIGIGYSTHLFALILKLLQINSMALWSWLLFLYIFGWVIFSILGYLYKIVPFLWWTHTYSDLIGKQDVPTLAQMVNEKWSTVLYSLFIIGLIGLLIGIVLHISIIVLLFQCILSIATIGYIMSIIKILFT